MDGDINNIHDKFVRASFMDVERAAAFFEQMLPVDILKVMSLETIEIIQESYITEDLKEYFSDIVYNIKLKENSEDDLEVALLFEHKSYPDKNVAFQVGHYMFSHWMKCVKEKKKLRLVIPIVYYQGEKAWKVPEIHERFSEYPVSILQYVPSLKHLFIALNTLSNEDVFKIQNVLMAVSIMAQKRRFDPIKFIEDFRRIFELFPSKIQDRNFFETIFVYIFEVSDLQEHDIKKAIESIPKPLNQEIMTTYQRIRENFIKELEVEKRTEWTEQGIEKGIEQGIEQGIEKGIEKGIEQGIEKGIEQGIEKGIEKNTTQVILTGYDNGISIELLSNITNKSEEEVRKILIENGRISENF